MIYIAANKNVTAKSFLNAHQYKYYSWNNCELIDQAVGKIWIIIAT